MILEELRQQHPDLVAQVEAEARAAAAAPREGSADPVAEAVRAEQRRLQEIDEVAGTLDASLVREAKYGRNCLLRPGAVLPGCQAGRARRAGISWPLGG